MHCLSTVDVMSFNWLLAANTIPGIKHAYIILVTLWKFFHYSTKRASLNEIQKVLDFSELNIA